MARGFLDYFPDAMAEVSHVSHVGNQQHNPGQSMHWAKEKSTDHADCILRHLADRGTRDDDGLRHSAKAAWRAMALLQIEIEEDQKLQAAGMDTYGPATIDLKEEAQAECDGRADCLALNMVRLGCPPHIAKTIAHEGVLFGSSQAPWIYIAGPMRGHAKFNFPAFDTAARRLNNLGFNVINPAAIGRDSAAARDPNKEDSQLQLTYAIRDFWSLAYIRSLEAKVPVDAPYKKGVPATRNGIALLPGWTDSTGASAEFFVGRWLGLTIYQADGTVHPDPHPEYIYRHD